MKEMSEKDLEDQFEKDLKDMVDTYRTWKNNIIWGGKIFAFMLLLSSLILAIKEIFKK